MLRGDLAPQPPPSPCQERWKIWNRRHYPHFIAASLRQVDTSLVNEDSVRWVDWIRKQACEGEYIQNAVLYLFPAIQAQLLGRTGRCKWSSFNSLPGKLGWS